MLNILRKKLKNFFSRTKEKVEEIEETEKVERREVEKEKPAKEDKKVEQIENKKQDKKEVEIKEEKEEIEKIKKDGVTAEEVERAVNQITAETAYDRDGSFSIASQLNEAIAMGDWTFYVNYLDNLKNVTPEQIQEVVKKYFIKIEKVYVFGIKMVF